MASITFATPSKRAFLPGAREELRALVSSSPSSPEALGSDCSSAAEELWSGVLGVALKSAKAQGDWNLAQALVRAGAEIGHLDLHEAVEGGHTELAAALVDHGACVDEEGENLYTPLHIVAKRDNAEISQMLLQKGADMEAASAVYFGSAMTPLCWAASSGSAAVVEVLMVAGADPHRVAESGTLSPLGEAANKGHDEVLKVMIRLGADVNINAVDGFGDTALHLARVPAVVDVLIEAGADIEARNELGFTPLFDAAAVKIAAVRALVNHGADINAKDPFGKTVLHRAAVHCWHSCTGVKVVDFLLRLGADETLVDNFGATPADLIQDYFAQRKRNIQRARKLLAEAPVDRIWRRRGLLLMGIARRRRGQFPCAASDTTIPVIDTQGTSRTGASGNDSWAGVLGWVAGMSTGGQEGIFRKIVGYL